MDRCALFVDAGYLLADGAMAVHSTRHREAVSWDFPGLLQLLGNLARERTGLPLLRCYWYEASVEGRRTQEHDALADLPGLKLRLGRIRPGRREGVDTEIHRDLMTLARNSAIADAIVVSGDEDLGQVVADAQDLGLRVTVVHVAVDGNWSISRVLRQECDDLLEIGAGHLRPYVNLLAGGAGSSSAPLSNGQATSTAASSAQAVPMPTGAHAGAPPGTPIGAAHPQQSHPQHTQPPQPAGQTQPAGQAADANSNPGVPASPHATAQPGPPGQGGGQGGETPPGQGQNPNPGQNPSQSTPMGGPGTVMHAAPVAMPSPPVIPAPGNSPGAPGHAGGGNQAVQTAQPGQPGQPSGQAQGQVQAQPQAQPQAQGQGQQQPNQQAAAQQQATQHQQHPQPPQAAPVATQTAPNAAPQTPEPAAAPMTAGNAIPQGPPAHAPPANAQAAQGTAAPSQPGGQPAYPPQQPSPFPMAQQSPQVPAVQQATPALSDAVTSAHKEGQDFGDSVARDAPALWLEAVLARKPRMPSDLEARLLQGSSLPIDFLLHDEVRHALRRGFWDALERSRR